MVADADTPTGRQHPPAGPAPQAEETEFAPEVGLPDLPPVSCCVRCHFAWEEREVFPYLPVSIRDKLLLEHGALRRLGYPKALVDAHAGREMDHVQAYCPAKLVAIVDADHGFLDESTRGGRQPRCRCESARV